MELPIGIIAFFGWLVWFFAELYIEKSQKEKDDDPSTSFTLKDYASSHWPVWIGSFLCIPILLWVGARNLSIDPLGSLLGEGSVVWHDLYILGSGAAFELFCFLVKKVKKYFAKKEAEL